MPNEAVEKPNSEPFLPALLFFCSLALGKCVVLLAGGGCLFQLLPLNPLWLLQLCRFGALTVLQIRPPTARNSLASQYYDLNP